MELEKKGPEGPTKSKEEILAERKAKKAEKAAKKSQPSKSPAPVPSPNSVSAPIPTPISVSAPLPTPATMKMKVELEPVTQPAKQSGILKVLFKISNVFHL